MIVGRMGHGDGFWAYQRNHTVIGARTAKAAVLHVRQMYVWSRKPSTMPKTPRRKSSFR